MKNTMIKKTIVKRRKLSVISFALFLVSFITLLAIFVPSKTVTSYKDLSYCNTIAIPSHAPDSSSYDELCLSSYLPYPDLIIYRVSQLLAISRKLPYRLIRNLPAFYRSQFFIPSLIPVSLDEGWISSEFGMRIHPISGKKLMHTGIDFAVDKGIPVRAAAEGKVIFAGKNGGYGLIVKVDHQNGIESWYAHNSELKVQKGDFVKKGEIIAISGATGYTTGEHLHYEVRFNGKPINPRIYLPEVIVEGGKERKDKTKIGSSTDK